LKLSFARFAPLCPQCIDLPQFGSLIWSRTERLPSVIGQTILPTANLRPISCAENA
jgi:hypothetical protein